MRFVGKTLQQVILCDVHNYPGRLLAVVKSLCTFAQQHLGYLPLDIAAPVKLPAVKNTRAGRILPEEAVHRMLALEATPRNHALLGVLYKAGLRVSEVCGLTWDDLHERRDTGQVTVFGKGGKTRVVLLSAGTWREVIARRGSASGLDLVFPYGESASTAGGMNLFRSITERILSGRATVSSRRRNAT